MSYKEAISFDELHKALHKACNGVRWKRSVVCYENNTMKNTYLLCKSLIDDKYKIDPYQYFTIYEPKKREICATRLKDRQFQRSLCNNGLYEQLTKSFISANRACLVGGGVDYSLDRLTAYLRKYNLKNGKDGWVLKCDIKHFFQSIDHDVAKAAVKKRVSDPDICQKVFDIIDSFGDVGLGLGSQVSQLVALAVLDDLDHFIKEKLKVKYYIRYMDDFILIDKDKKFIEYCLKEITIKINELKLEFNDKKTLISPLKNGVKFLKWSFIISDTGKIVRLMDKKKLGKQRRRLKRIYKKEKAGEYEPGTTKQSLCCWLANAERGDTYWKRKKMINFYNDLIKN